MAIKITEFGGTDWENGEVLNATDLIETVSLTKSTIKEIYTSTAFNCSASAGQTIGNSYEASAYSATNKNYIKAIVRCNVGGSIGNTGSGRIRSYVKLEIKETGGSYADADGYVTLVDSSEANQAINDFKEVTLIYQLTPEMKANGYQIKITGQAIAGEISSSAFITNNKVIIIEEI